MAIIRLENMAFYAYHGCFDEETQIGTHFRVDVEFVAQTSIAEKTDRIEDTVSYLTVYQSIKKQMQAPSHLLESVTHRIGTTLLLEFPAIEKARVKTSKLNPPLGGELEAVSVELDFYR